MTYSMFHANGTKSAKDIRMQFKNVPNIQMRGTTFDVRHLDRFIQMGAANQTGSALQSVKRMSVAPSTLSKPDTNNANIGGSALSTVQGNSNNEHGQFVSLNARDDLTEQDNFNKRLSASSPTKMMSARGQAVPNVYTNIRPSTAFIAVSREN